MYKKLILGVKFNMDLFKIQKNRIKRLHGNGRLEIAWTLVFEKWENNF